MAVDPVIPQRTQHVSNEALALNTSSFPHVDDDDVINIQLPYNPNRPMEPELWDGNFHPISTHRSLEHLASDANNIKKSLACMAKYIKNRKIETSKSNDFKGIGKATWELISSIYNSGWDSLIADNHKNSLRQKIAYKFILKVNPEKNDKKGEKNTNKPASIKRLPPLIPAKSLKKVNKISKYFKFNKLTQANTSQTKSYTKATKTSSNTKEVLRIKETVLSL